MRYKSPLKRYPTILQCKLDLALTRFEIFPQKLMPEGQNTPVGGSSIFTRWLEKLLRLYPKIWNRYNIRGDQKSVKESHMKLKVTVNTLLCGTRATTEKKIGNGWVF